MVSPDARYLKPSVNRAWHDLVIEHGVVALLVFSPLAFGSVHLWAASLLQIGAFVIFLVWAAKPTGKSRDSIRGWHIILPMSMFAFLVLFQLIPLPSAFVRAISPSTASLYDSLGVSSEAQWHSLSIHPQATIQALLNMLAYLSIFIVIVNHVKSRELFIRLTKTIIAMGSLLVCIAILQKAFWNGKLYWFYPLNEGLQSRIDYIWGPYVNRNHFAGYLEQTIPLIFGYLSFLASKRREGNDILRSFQSPPQFTYSWRLPKITYLLLAVVVTSGALFATLSRGAIASSLISTILFYLFVTTRKTLNSKMLRYWFMAVVLGSVGFFSAWDRIENRVIEIAYKDNIARTQVWSDLTVLVRDFPVFGTGLGTFDRAFLRYQSRYSNVRFEHAENDYLEVLTDTGLVGFSLVIVTCVIFFKTTIRMWKHRKNTFSICMGAGGLASCFAIAVHSVVDFNLRIPANAFLLSVIAGMTVSGLIRNDGETLLPAGNKRDS